MMIRIILLMIFGIVFSSCKSENELHAREEAAIQKISAFYDNERAGNWEFTYQCRPDRFKDVVSYNVYVKELEKDRMAWEPSEYDIKDMKFDGSTVYARMEFKETFLGSDKNENNDVKFSFHVEEITEWIILSDGSIVCVNPGVRRHHSLNKISDNY